MSFFSFFSKILDMGCASSQAFILTGFLGTIAVLGSGCGVYQNQGRKSFEERSYQTLQPNVGISSTPVCWKQSADEPIWPVETHLQIKVQRIDNNQLLICAEEAS